MPNQLQEAYEDLKALSHAHQIMAGDPTIGAALAVAEQRMLQAAYSYAMAAQGKPANGSSQVRPAMHRPPGVSDDRQKPYSRNSGVSVGAVALPIAPLNAPAQAPATVQRLPTTGHVPTAPGLPDAVVPSSAQMHPRTIARIQAAQGGVPAPGDGAVQLPAPKPGPGGDLPDVPLMDPPGAPGAPATR
jgi:hypothetical protein